MPTSTSSRQMIRLSFDNVTFELVIERVSLRDVTWSKLNLLLSSCIGDLELEKGRILRIPWSEFRNSLSSLAQFVKDEDLSVEYDGMSRELINAHLREVTFLRNAGKIAVGGADTLEKELAGTQFKRKLTPEQLRDAARLIALTHGANFSVPGAGKTATLLAVHSILKAGGSVSNLMVVAPRNAFISWEDEMDYCFDNPKRPVRLTGGRDKIASLLQSSLEVSLITYQQLPIVVDDVTAYTRRNRVHLVLDESHRIKRGFPGAQYVAAIAVAGFASRRDIMSGTPMPQAVSDLVSQFEFLWPGGHVLSDLRESSESRDPILAVNRRIANLFVRTTKKELHLSPVSIAIKRIRLGPIQSQLYDLLRSESARTLSGMNRDERSLFRALGRHAMRLLEAASNPGLIVSDTAYYDDVLQLPSESRVWELLSEFSKYEKPAKIEYVLGRIRELSNANRKVVVWSSFIGNILLLEKALQKSGLESVSIYGMIETGDDAESDTREGRIRKFHEDPSCRVMIGNPAACGEGISLHKVCHDAIYLDRTFNAAYYMQSVDRIHRLGLPPDTRTNVEIVQAQDTIDEIVDDRLRYKVSAMAKVLDDYDLQQLAFDPSDVEEEAPSGLEQGDVQDLMKHISGGHS